MPAHNHKFGKLAILAIAASLLLSLTTMAMAESDAVRAIYLSAANVPTNIAGINTYAEPPKGFNPLTASDVELATYGFPQRPDKLAEPGHYATWERAMQAARIRWNGELKPMHLGGHRAPLAGQSPAPQAVQPQAGPSHWNNISGSGVVLTNTQKTWSSSNSFNDIYAAYTVATAQTPFANGFGCTASDYLSISMVGIDGQITFGANGVPFFLPEEAVGAYEDYSCVYGVATYTAVLGWQNVLNGVFSLNPGDLFYTEVHAFGGCNAGSAFVEDLTTLTYNAYTITNDCFENPQIGRTANFVVWRPCCDGPGPDGAWPLANTIGIFMDGAAFTGNGKVYFPGSQASSTQILTMTDDGGTQTIEGVYSGNTGWEGQRTLQFYTTGCAYTGGCNP